MELLQNEFIQADEGSYTHNLGQLVKKIRFAMNASGNEVGNLNSEIKALHKKVQDFDDMLGNPKRDYVNEIIDELNQENETENALSAEIERCAKPILKALVGHLFTIDEISFEFYNNETVMWIEFYGFSAHREDNETLNIVRDVFRSVCAKSGVIFIDSSNNVED